MQQTTIVVEQKSQKSVVEEMKNLIISHYRKIKENKTTLRAAKEMMSDAFANDTAWSNSKEEEGSARNDRKVIEEKIKNNNPTVADKIQTLQSEQKEIKEALSDYLKEYCRMTGDTEIETPEGEKLTIVQKVTIEQLKLL